MIKPATPVDELLRLETLRNLKILDTNPEERFDRVTRLAKKVFGTPIALVSLVDADRQWFKSRQGLEATETPRDISFCGHAILEDSILVVEDAQADERFCDNPLVTDDPSIRFYAGYPISGPRGQKIGTLCIIDREPREMSPDDRDLLTELGEMVEEELAIADMVRNDPTTGLSNRAGFVMIAEHLLAMCARTDVPASLMLFHLSNLGDIDVSFGSTESDRAVIEMTQLVLASFRDSDIVGRIAPDIFVVLLASSRSDGADVTRERFERNIDDRNAASNGGYDLDVDSYVIVYNNMLHADVESLLESAEELIDGIEESMISMTGRYGA